MKAKEVKEYVKKLGLENKFNCMKQVVGDNVLVFTDEEELRTYAVGMMIRMQLEYGKDNRFSIFFLRDDNTVQGYVTIGDEVLVTRRLPLETIREINEALPLNKLYVLLVENKKNHFEVVTTEGK